MMKHCSTIFVCFALIVQTAVAFAGQLPSSLELYREKTQSVLVEEKNGEVKTYLHTCLAAADQLNGLEASDSRVPAAFSTLVQMRLRPREQAARERAPLPRLRGTWRAGRARSSRRTRPSPPRR